MDLHEFIAKWSVSELKESSASHEHFIDLCNLLGEKTPAASDPTGSTYCFEKGVRKTLGSKGWADVWKRKRFAWEYKGPHKSLDAALEQLRQYASSLENPPLLVVSDMKQFRIHTNWTNSVSEVHSFALEQLTDGEHLDKLRWVFSDPCKLKPGKTRQELTEKAASAFAELAQGMRQRGHEPQEVAHFINRLVFCMFAEDVRLLPQNLFTEILDLAQQNPGEFVGMARDLFGAMAKGGRFGAKMVDWFNGGLFDDDSALPLNAGEIKTTLRAAELDWSEIDPAIMGTLFERGLDPDKRSQLGAHYTDREKISQIIEPTIARPLLREWESVKAEIKLCLDKATKAKTSRSQGDWRKKADGKLRHYIEELRDFTVLDPACGSGNFLYLALRKLKDIEHHVQMDAETLGFPRQFPGVGPANVKGIEKNLYAAELARVSVWIGEIQWMRQNGFGGARKPVLQPLETIQCGDALLNHDGSETEWPEADVIVGNPPFIGGDLVRSRLGVDYRKSLRLLFGNRISGKADFVCHWFDKAQRLVTQGKVTRVGLVATNSIREGQSRGTLERIVENNKIFDAWADEPWESDGASVRVSIVCFSKKDSNLPIRLNGNSVETIHSDLTSDSVDITLARKLSKNKNVSFKGGGKTGAFDIPGDVARKWLILPINPNGRPNSDVLKPWINAKDLTDRPTGKWIVDFGSLMSEEEAALYEIPFSYLQDNVKPKRRQNRIRKWREYWWQLGEARPKMWAALTGMTRYIATPRHSKHRVFAWCDIRICPDSALVIIARDDETTLGILHSRFHEAWSRRLGSSLEDRLRYTSTTTFQTFPFPEALTPDLPASNYADDSRAIAIAKAAKRLVKLRDNWLNPIDKAEWVDEPVPGYPKRPVARSESAEKVLQQRTLTNLYNANLPWLQNAHADLDAAVAAAYDWPENISTEDALAELLKMNLNNSK